MNGAQHPFNATVTATNLQTRGGDTRDETIKKAGVGAAAGAVLGAIMSKGDLDKILLGGVLAFTREYLDKTIHDARTLQHEFDQPVLAEIPHLRSKRA